jgi:hypothetical protein
MDTKECLQLAQVAVTLGGFLFAILQLRSEYRWRRNQYAVNMLGDWNNRVVVHRMSIEAAFPGLMDATDGERCRQAVTRLAERAKEIYFALPKKREEGQPETDWELREHFIELLNYCEYVASSHDTGVGDGGMLVKSFGATLARWHEVLQPFMEVLRKHRGYDPWGPLDMFVILCRKVHGLGIRSNAAGERGRAKAGASADGGS